MICIEKRIALVAFIGLAMGVLQASPVLAAVFSEDFEAKTTADLSIAPWSNPLGFTATVETGAGTNSTNVVNLSPNDLVRYTAAPGDQLLAGTIEFDMYMEGSATVGPGVQLYIQSPVGWTMSFLRFQRGWGGTGDIDVITSAGGANIAVDVMAHDTWAHVKYDFDNATELYSLAIDGNTVYTDLAYTEGGGHDFSSDPFGKMQWQNLAATAASSPFVQLDNVTVSAVPEPATLCLLALGGVALAGGRHKKNGNG